MQRDHQIAKDLRDNLIFTYFSKEERGERMTKYKCTVCGYIYDPEVGDPDSGINPGTSFEDLPDDWICPICGVSKDQFEKVE